MAVFVCRKCGAVKESRCKPRTCPKCGAKDSFVKQS